MLLVIGVPFALRPAQPVVLASATAERLVIITPHNEQIRVELSRAYNAFRQAQGKDAIVFDWRSSGGTSDLRKQVLSTQEKNHQNLKFVHQHPCDQFLRIVLF